MEKIKWKKHRRKENPPFAKITPEYRIMFNVAASKYLDGFKNVNLFFDEPNLKITIQLDDDGEYVISRQKGRRNCSVCVQGIMGIVSNVDINRRYEVEQVQNGVCVSLAETRSE